jgi:uncharacterized protein with von Willebrand factor type A (vWA) domain
MIDEVATPPGPSEEGLLDNIVRFSFMLREKGIAIALPAVLDVMRGLPLIDISDRDAFQCLLRTNLLCRHEDMDLFEMLFYSYFLTQNQTTHPPHSLGNGEVADEQSAVNRLLSKMADLNSAKDPAISTPQPLNVRYSPDSLLNSSETQALDFTESRILYESINNLLRPLTNRNSRRLKYSIRGHDISLRTMLRKNMQFGGELLLLDYKKRKIKKRRIIFFGDVSGSMDIHTLMILQFVHALRQIDRRTEIFFFSTDISRGTHQFDTHDFAAAIAGLQKNVVDWGGGTRIGHCLRRFNDDFGKRMLSSKSIVLIFSDGWDRGEVDMLAEQMALLQRRAYKIIWLNPLAGARDYQPICQGMSAALPYVDSFLPMAGPQDIQNLSHKLEKIII